MANVAYHKQYIRQFTLKFSLTRDADILAYLETLPNVQGYFKDLLRAAVESPETPEDPAAPVPGASAPSSSLLPPP